MKKQTKIILGIVITVVVVLLAVSFFLPGTFDRLTMGTFGKVDRFRKNQMSEKDIKLRSEFTSDTAELKKMISGLIYFNAFTNDLSNKIDSTVDLYKLKGLNAPDAIKNLNLLKDYSTFIRNNNKTLETTIQMLAGFYLKLENDSIDVEKNLREFSNYVKNLNEKDSVLELSIKSMDQFLLTNKTLKTRKTEFVQLKSIRDRLLIKGIQTAGILRDQDLGSVLIHAAISSQESFGNVYSNVPGLNFTYNSQEELKYYSTDNLNVIIKSSGSINLVDVNQAVSVNSQETNNAIHSSQGPLNLWHSGVVYDAVNLSFVVGSASEINNQQTAGASGAINSSQTGLQIFLRQGGIGVLFVGSNGGISVAESNLNVSNLINSQGIRSHVLNIPSLGVGFTAAGNYGSIGMNFVDIVEAINNDLGSAVIK
jgi:hypothetical protein